MGTNYYHRTNKCPHCGRFEERHIGKSSCGWTFGFRAHEGIESYKDWLKVLGSGGKIYDEYGDEISLFDFKEMVEDKRKEKYNHTKKCKDGWLDDEGNSFTDSEFS